MPELWDLYDETRNLVSKRHERGVPLQKGEYHLVVGVWVMDADNRILVTKRHPDKPWGGYWECTGGAVVAGEGSVTSAMRELREETGLSVRESDLHFLGTMKYDHWFTDSFATRVGREAGDLVLQPEEVVDARWVHPEALCRMCREGIVIPFVQEQFYAYRKQIEALPATRPGLADMREISMIPADGETAP